MRNTAHKMNAWQQAHPCCTSCCLQSLKKALVKVNGNFEGLFSRTVHTQYLHPSNFKLISPSENRPGHHFPTSTRRLRTAGCSGIDSVSLHWYANVLRTVGGSSAASLPLTMMIHALNSALVDGLHEDCNRISKKVRISFCCCVTDTSEH